MKTAKHNFFVEITDTYGGEANYSWVRRYLVRAKSTLGAVQKIAREYGAGWTVDFNDGDMARHNLRGATICMFTRYVDETEAAECLKNYCFIEQI